MTKIWPIPVEDPDYYDPILDKSRHPQLHAGYNFDPINGDELNGAGINEPVWPNWFDSFEPLKPVIVTAEMMSFFAEECPDLCVAPEEDTVYFGREVDELELRRA